MPFGYPAKLSESGIDPACRLSVSCLFARSSAGEKPRISCGPIFTRTRPTRCRPMQSRRWRPEMVMSKTNRLAGCRLPSWDGVSRLSDLSMDSFAATSLPRRRLVQQWLAGLPAMAAGFFNQIEGNEMTDSLEVEALRCVQAIVVAALDCRDVSAPPAELVLSVSAAVACAIGTIRAASSSGAESGRAAVGADAVRP